MSTDVEGKQNNEADVDAIKQKQKGKNIRILILVLVLLLVLIISIVYSLSPKENKSKSHSSEKESSNVENRGEKTETSTSSSSSSGTVNTNNQNSSVKSYAGTIGNSPVRIVLQYSDSATMHAYYTGSLVYEGVSDRVLNLKGYFLNNTKADCQNYCEFYFDEIDGSNVTGKLTGKVDDDKTLTGQWENIDGTKKFDLKLKDVENFNINDYLKKASTNGFKYDVKALSKGILAECYKITDTLDSKELDTKVESEVYSTKLNKKYVTISGSGSSCAGNVNTPWILYQITENGKATKILEEEVSNGGQLFLSPDQTKLVVTEGSHGGICYDTYTFSVINLNTNKQVGSVSPDQKSKNTLFIASEIKWVDSSTINYKVLSLSEEECMSNSNSENGMNSNYPYSLMEKLPVKTLKV
ncbi:MAG: hypothetical protein OHK0017_09870 [Patescibacteria group bacterium]